MANEYPAGTPEAEAHALGYEYATLTGGIYDAPLSGEWADMPTIHSVNLTVARTVYGPSWTLQDVDDDIESGEWDSDGIADAFEYGYAAYREEHGK